MALDLRYQPAPNLQEQLVDKDTGLPLTGGIVTFYSDINRTILKPIFEITGSPPNYTYAPLPNPLTLSGVGTFQDSSGNDVIPYFFPYAADGATIELYYITVVSSTGVPQFTREGFPNVGAGESIAENIINYIPNGQFLAHDNIPATDTTIAGEITEPITTVAQGGWTFERPSLSTATDIVTFTPFNSFVDTPSGNPLYAINIENQVPSSGDAFKDLKITFNNVNQFASDAGSQEYTFGFWAQSLTGSTVNVQLIQINYFGPDGSPQPNQEIPLTTFTIEPAYTLAPYQFPFSFGDNLTSVIDPNGGDYVQLAIRLPVNTVFNVQLTSFILTVDNVVISEFPIQTEADTLARSLVAPVPDPNGNDLYLNLRLTPSGLEYDHSEVGNVYPTMYETAGLGQVVADGSKFLVSGYSPEGIPYSRLWNKCIWMPTYSLPKFGTGLDYMTAYIADFSPANYLRISTNQGGTVVATSDGTNPTGFTFNTVATSSTVTGGYYLTAGKNHSTYPSTTGLVTGNFQGNVTDPGVGTLTGFVVTPFRNTVSQIIAQYFEFFTDSVTPATIAGKYWTFSSYNAPQTSSGVLTHYYMWFTVDGTGTDPAPSSMTGIKVNILSTYTTTELASVIVETLKGLQISSIKTVAGSSIVSGSYFLISSTSVNYVVWYRVNGVGTAPVVPSRINIMVDILSTDTDVQVATKTQTILNSQYFAVPDGRGLFLRGWTNGTNISLYDVSGRFNPYFTGIGQGLGNNDAIGSVQEYELYSHTHVGGITNPNAFIVQAAGTPIGTLNTGNELGTVNIGSPNSTVTVAVTGGYEVRPANMYFNYLIKI